MALSQQRRPFKAYAFFWSLHCSACLDTETPRHTSRTPSLRRFLASWKNSSGHSTLCTTLSRMKDGDLRPENITVQYDNHNKYLISGILDWEKSGFYPDYFESTKATSNMSTSDTNDWYLYLPRCASPTRHPSPWLVDRIWDIHIA